MRTAVLLCGIVMALTVTLAAPARAATVDGYYEIEIRDEYGGLIVTDESKERNDITIESRGSRVLVRERGPEPLRPKGDCVRKAKRLVSCPSEDVEFGPVRVRLGEGDDRARVRLHSLFYRVRLFGGPGEDVLASRNAADLKGEGGRDRLEGGPEHDHLFGGPGRDTLVGGSGPDLLSGDGWGDDRADASAADDRLLGGLGRDTATWERRERRVFADLNAPAHGGVAGERDSLRSIEGLAGGSAGDRLVGDGRSNRLLGGPGEDVLIGGAGVDRIDGGTAGGLRDAGPDGSGDHISCGAGGDRVAGVGVDRPRRTKARADAVPQDCERMSMSRFGVRVPRLVYGSTRVLVEVVCPKERCRRRVVIGSGGRVLGRSRRVSMSRTGGKRPPRTVAVHLAEPLAPGPPIEVVLAGRNHDPYFSGSGWRARSFTYRLLRP